MDVSETGIRPTPETQAKAVEGVIGQLQRRKYLWPEHVAAAFEIEEAFRALTSPVSMRLMRYGQQGYELRRPEFVARLSDRTVALIGNYNDWVDELATRNLEGVYGVVVDIVVLGSRLREVERRWHLRNSTGKERLRTGLQIYCEVVGWLGTNKVTRLGDRI